jgi:hydroxymethylbilane synthase
MTTIRIATRSSAQARTQAEAVGALLTAARAGVVVEYVFVDTQGDINATTPLHLMGGQGVFVKEVQRAVLENRADVAVHSAKDLPSQNADGLFIGAIGERRTANDALVGKRLEELAVGATIATGSVRRRAQLMRIRPDLQFVDLRGNIQTRLSKIPDGGAIVGQGSVAVEARTDDAETRAILALIDHAASRRAVETERAFLAELGAGCSLPVGAHLSSDGVFRAFMANDDFSDSVQIVGSIGDSDDNRVVGITAAIECRSRLAKPRS